MVFLTMKSDDNFDFKWRTSIKISSESLMKFDKTTF